ncbi:YraN family protein [Tahibacter amnicola]|uniref:UPF0102 protein N4264_23965 n=1 Tax=Tahibacter amnicola TaxID=2976241 RepID=A0ABY6BIS4_9GAMM|nr:YraN family protein [Tahibacter amnicola]UXI67752.1 YraN family protein [Tahibacter amnicola]
MTTRDKGAAFETAALTTLEKAGLTLIARNWQCRYGEIDLVMREADTVVFVEVRYRVRTGDGLSSIGPQKQAKLVRAAQMFLAERPALARQPCRFDTVAFSRTDDNAGCDWQRAAFDAF